MSGVLKNEQDARQVYADIFDLPHHVSKKHEHMSLYDRAAQFSSFNALTGYEDMVDEEARQVGEKHLLSETETEMLNSKLNLLNDLIGEGVQPEVTITYFVPDTLKSGGSYEQITERVRKVDDIERKVQLFCKVGLSGRYMEIAVDDIKDISGEVPEFIDFVNNME